jgi:hypothetical protein
MLMKNSEIYNYAQALTEAFRDNNQRLPVKINFYLQKNKKTLLSLSQDIEQSRMEIAQNYGTINEEGTAYTISEENIVAVNNEIQDLLNIEQEVPIYQVSIDSFSDDLTFTTAQMEAIMFMID